MVPELELREGWTTVVCLLLILLCVAWSIQAAEWTEGLATLQAIVLVGGGLGIVVAKSRTPNRLAHALSLLAGVTWSTFLTSRVLANSLSLPTEITAVELQYRLWEFGNIVFSGGTSADNHVFVLLLSLLMWLLAYFCAWAVYRWQRAWWAVIVSGLALMVNINYAKTNLTAYLIGFLLFALLLIVRTSLAHYEQEWRSAGVGYSSDLVHSFLQTGLIVSAAAILLAWLAPEALASRGLQQVWDKVGEPWRRFQDESSRIFQDLNYQNEPLLISTDRETRFGGAVGLTDTPILDVRAATGRYWRVMVYHEYTSTGWKNTDTDTISIEENGTDLAVPELAFRREITQTFTLLQDLGSRGTIAAAGQPLRAAIAINAVVAYLPADTTLFESGIAVSDPLQPGDPSVLYSRAPLQAGESYQVMSSLTRADEESLRQAGTDYPLWVVPRYRELPDSLPTRVRLLAEQITADQETPYDKAKAIEAYLREIPYNLIINAPAPGQDGVDYFLFESKQGYCDYYASAMVVMLRSVDIPARYVRGYSNSNKEEGVYHIIEKNSHAWPEVFFPGYGWIEFEPTGGEPPLNRPRTQPNPSDNNTNDSDRSMYDRFPDEEIDAEIDPGAFASSYTPPKKPLWQRIGRWGWFALTQVALVLVLIALYVVRRRRKVEGLSVGERVYEDLVDWVRRLFRLTPLAHQTPNEYAGIVSQSVPKGQRAVERIASLYVQERFGHKKVSSAEADVAWNQAQSALWRRWIDRRFDGVKRIWWKLVPPREAE